MNLEVYKSLKNKFLYRYFLTLPFHYINTLMLAIFISVGGWISQSNISLYTLAVIMLLVVAAYVCFGSLSMYNQRQLHMAVYESGKELRNKLVEAMFLNGSDRKAKITSSVVLKDVEKIEENLFRASIDLVEQLLLYVIAFIVIAIQNLWIAVFMMLLSAFVAKISYAGMKKADSLQKQDSMETERNMNLLLDTEQGYESIRMYQQENTLIKQFNESVKKLRNYQEEFIWSQNKIALTMMETLFFSALLAMIVGNLLIGAGRLNIVQMLAILQLSNSMFKPIQKGLTAFVKVRSMRKVTGDIEYMLKQGRELAYKEKGQEEFWATPLRQDLQIHIPSLKRQGREILKNIEIHVKRGEKVLLIGENGCGKSTLLKSILGEFDYPEGSLLVDGQDAAKLDIGREPSG